MATVISQPVQLRLALDALRRGSQVQALAERENSGDYRSVSGRVINILDEGFIDLDLIRRKPRDVCE